MIISRISRSGPVSDAIGEVSKFFGAFIKTITGGFGQADNKWLVDQSVYFGIIAAAIVMIKFWMDVLRENKGRKAEDKIIGTGAAITFLGMRLLLVPLIAFASAIPAVFVKMTPSAFAATTATATRVAGVGDGLITQMRNFWGMQVQGGYQKVLNMSAEDGAKLSKEEYQGALSIQKSYGAASTALDKANSNLQNALTNKALPKDLARARQDVAHFQKPFQEEHQRLTEFYGRVGGKLGEEGAKNADTARLRLRLAAVTAALGNEAELNKLGIHSVSAGNYNVARSAGDVASGQIETLKAEIHNKGTIGVTDATRIIADFIGHIGFYACILPALLGIIAGAVIALKEALSIIQFGAKVDVMKGLAFTFSAFFAPIFMLSFMFPKTENFGWKFVSFLFSVYFGVWGISYVCGVVANVGFASLGNTVSSLIQVQTGYLAKEASQALFESSLGIGLKALGVGLLTAFAADITKSSLQVGQGMFNGSFNA